MLPNGTEAWRDPNVITPGLERVAPELLALVADDVFGRATCVIDGALEEALNRHGCGIVPESAGTASGRW